MAQQHIQNSLDDKLAVPTVKVSVFYKEEQTPYIKKGKKYQDDDDKNHTLRQKYLSFCVSHRVHALVELISAELVAHLKGQKRENGERSERKLQRYIERAESRIVIEGAYRPCHLPCRCADYRGKKQRQNNDHLFRTKEYRSDLRKQFLIRQGYTSYSKFLYMPNVSAVLSARAAYGIQLI